MIKEIFEANIVPHKSSGKFSISQIGSCRRKLFLTMKGRYKEDYDPKMWRNFALGDLFHQQAAKELLEKSEQFGFHVTAQEVNIPEHPFLSGRADQIISNSKTGEMIICDIKSAGDWTINKAKQGEVSESYINQVQLYLHLFGFKRGFILYYGKHKGEIFEYEIIYDKERCLKLIAEIEQFMKDVEADKEPEKCDGGDFGCKCCGTGKI